MSALGEDDVCQAAAPPLVTIDGGASRCARVDELRGTLHGVDA